jgi:hypothetical protein
MFSWFKKRKKKISRELAFERYWKIKINKKRVLHKLDKGLLKILENEKINLQFYPDEESLNLDLFNETEKSNFAGGVYQYYSKFKKDIYVIRNESFKPTIYLPKNYLIWTLAHELGHHFAITNMRNRSEEAADKYIKTLCGQILDEIELYALAIDIHVYSGYKGEDFNDGEYFDTGYKLKKQLKQQMLT